MPWFRFSIGKGGEGAQPLQSVVDVTDFPAPTFGEALGQAKTMAAGVAASDEVERVCLTQDGVVVWSTRVQRGTAVSGG